ncbi:MAG: carbonate dehydratase [Myxococcales bacterium]|nr:carbonate dehydratase [Myxococcales bacterium]
MKTLPHLFESNRAWAAKVRKADPAFFERLSKQQSPKLLWIGCSDSRVPATEICGLEPGEIFVHRNISNVVVHTDFNCLSVLQFAVDVLHVTDVIVCGHYGCGGIRAALDDKRHGLIDNWLRHIKDVYVQHEGELNDPKLDPEARVNRFCELNVKAQVANLCATTVVQEAWARGDELAIHGWIYGLGDGLLKDLGVCITALDQLPSIYRMKSAKAG